MDMHACMHTYALLTRCEVDTIRQCVAYVLLASLLLAKDVLQNKSQSDVDRALKARGAISQSSERALRCMCYGEACTITLLNNETA